MLLPVLLFDNLSHLQVLNLYLTYNVPGSQSLNCRLAKVLVASKQLQLCVWSHVLHKPQLLSATSQCFASLGGASTVLADMSCHCTMLLLPPVRLPPHV